MEPPPRPSLLDRLPDAHAQALLLRAAGAGDATIAEALDVPVESVPTLLAVAEAKLSSATNDAEEATDAEATEPRDPS